MHKLMIIGAGGHGKVVADIAYQIGYRDIVFLDDNHTGECIGFPIVGQIEQARVAESSNVDCVVAIGDNEIRKQLVNQYRLNWVSLIHPSARIATEVSIGKGTVVMAGAIINTSTIVGNHCIINTGAIVEHDNTISDYVHISSNATLGGVVSVGERVHIGLGAIIKNQTSICADCVIGAGAVVVKNLESPGVYAGVPAKKM